MITGISGFHSKLEKDVFHYLAKGDQPIILALPRGLKTRWEPEIQRLLKSDRLLVVTPIDNSVENGSPVIIEYKRSLYARNIGHFGTGDQEITIRNEEDLTKADPLFVKSYQRL